MQANKLKVVVTVGRVLVATTMLLRVRWTTQESMQMRAGDRTLKKKPSYLLFAKRRKKANCLKKRLISLKSTRQKCMPGSSRSSTMLSRRSTPLPTKKRLLATAVAIAERRVDVVGPRETTTRMAWNSTSGTMMILPWHHKSSAENTSGNSSEKHSTITTPWNSTRARLTWTSIWQWLRRSNSRRNMLCTWKSTMRTS